MMSVYGPLETALQTLLRAAHYIEGKITTKPGVIEYQVYGASSLDDAYGNPTGSNVGGAGATALFTVPREGDFRSPTIRAEKRGRTSGSTRGFARFVFDPADYPAPLLPEGHLMYLRVQENVIGVGYRTVLGAVDTGDPVLGPIYVMPTPEFFSAAKPVLTLSGTAPQATTSTLGGIPAIDMSMQTPNPMHLVLPAAAEKLTVTNTDGATDILISPSVTGPMLEVPFGTSVTLDGTLKEVLVASAGAATPVFTIEATINFGRN